MTRVLIFGAGPQGRVVLETMCAQGNFEVVGFLDDDSSRHGTCVDAALVLGGWSLTKSVADGDAPPAFAVAIGDNDARVFTSNELRIRNLELVNVIHPSATVMVRTTMGTGNLICAGAIVVTGTRLENDIIINTGATIDHDSVLHTGAQIAAGVHTAGSVTIGRGAFIGVGAVIGPNVTIGDRCIVGAGSVVLSDLPPNVLAFGTPAKVIRQLDGPVDWCKVLAGGRAT